MKRFPFLTWFFAGLTLLIHGSPTLTDGLQLQRNVFAEGQLWRLFTGHFTHFDASHLTWDVLAFLLFGSLVEMRSRSAWTWCVAAGAVAISLGVVLLQPQFTHYRGLSGLDSGFFAFLAVDRLCGGWRTRDGPLVAVALAACAGFLGKTLYEIALGQTLFVDSAASFEPVPLAHLVGAVAGTLTVGAVPLKPPLPATRTGDDSDDPNGPLRPKNEVEHAHRDQTPSELLLP